MSGISRTISSRWVYGLGLLGLATSLSACQVESSEGQGATPSWTEVQPAESLQERAASFQPTSTVLSVTAAQDNTILVSDVLANAGSDVNPASFTLLDGTTFQGGALELNQGEISYTPDIEWSWDAFEYEVCDNAATPTCQQARVQLVIEGSTAACSAIDLEESFKMTR